jgi:hypothetical protein
LLYTVSPYKIQLFAEMCKPAVYVYDKNNFQNSLNINYENGNYFTKTIPELNIKDGWEFV